MRKENITIATPGAIHFIYYGSHITTVKPKSLPESVTGYALETGSMANYIRETPGVLNSYRECRQYRDVFTWLEKKKVPVYFCDTEFGVMNTGIVTLIEACETMLHLGSVTSTLSATVAETLNLFTHHGRDFALKMRKIPNLFKDERAFWTLKLRNILWAHKLQWLAGQSKGPHFFGSILGPHHTGVEQELIKSPEQRLDYLLSTRFAWRRFIAPEVFPCIQQYKYNLRSQKWEPSKRFTVPELEELITKDNPSL